VKDAAKSLEWITDVFAIQGRVLQMDETRESIAEWDSLGTMVLQSRLKQDHGIVLGNEQASRIGTVQEICYILDRRTETRPQQAPLSPSAVQGSLGRRPLKDRLRRSVGKLASIGQRVLSKLSSRQKGTLRTLHRRVVNTFLSYTPEELLETLRSLGVTRGDTVLVHSSFHYANGFVGSPAKVIDVLLESVGSNGNLMMVSLPYTSSTFDYLRSLDCFDVRRTVSRMGLLTEMFRGREDVRRSLSPTHPILACGPKAEWILSGHENCPYPCGAGTPFEKLAELEGKVVFFDAPFASLTFFHYIEDMYRDLLPYSLYHPEAFEVPVIDDAGRRITAFVYAFSPAMIKRRRPYEFEAEVRKQQLIKSAKIGTTKLEYIEVRPLLEFVSRMVKRGNFFFYDLS
jgi:aminoglycoside 3-N-acetyltransferase